MQFLRLTASAMLDLDGRAFAAISQANLLAPTVEAIPSERRTVAWSGWFGDADPSRGHFERDFRTWSPDGWAALARTCHELAPSLEERGHHLLLRPHSRHVLADPQACVNFFRTRENGPFWLLLDPASMLTPSMLPSAEDHLARMFGALAAHPATAAILLANVARPEPDDDLLVPAPLHAGLLDPGLIIGAWRFSAGDQTPCVLLDEQFDGQVALLT